MNENSKENYGIDFDNPEFDGEGSLDPQRENGLYNAENINIGQKYFSIFELKRKYDKTQKQFDKNDYTQEVRVNQIILDSKFQREAVWVQSQKSELIESVLMGLPIPIMYLSEDKAANLIVVDGRQRLTAFFEFLDEKYELKGLKILKELNQKKFGDIDPVYQSKLEDYQLMAQIIKPPTPDTVMFNIFDRVNRGGTSLNNQEMRNALYQGNSTKLLETISKNDLFKEATGKSIDSKRMKDRYLILRAIAFYLWAEEKLTDKKNDLIEYKGDIDELLGKTMEYLNFIEVNLLKDIVEKINKGLSNSIRIFGEDGFRLQAKNRRSPVNMNIFESIMYVMVKLDEEKSFDIQLKNLYNELIQDSNYLDNIANHRDSKNKYEDRKNIVIDKFKEVINFD